MSRSSDLIRQLLDVVVSSGLGFEDQIERILLRGCRELGMELGILAEVREQAYEVVASVSIDDLEVAPGASFELGRTYCRETIAASGPVGFHQATGSEWERHPAFEDFRLEAYIGAPVHVGGQLFGTLNFSRRTARPTPLTEEEHDFVRLAAAWAGAELEREQSRKELTAAREALGAVLHSSVDGIMAFTSVRNDGDEIVDFRWTIANPAGAKMVGYAPAELLGRRLLEVLPGNRADGLFDRYRTVVATGRSDQFVHRYSHEGVDAWFRISAVKTGDGFAVGFADISDLKRTEDALRRLAEYDPLTDLRNRASFLQQLELAATRRRSGKSLGFAVAYLDFDRFKIVNDSLGHHAGDALLRSIAWRLSGSIKPDDIAARLGGDEFAVLLRDIDSPDQARRVAERLLAVFAKPHEIEGHPIVSTASIGVALAADAERKGADVLRDADAAMYEAKAAGRNRVVLVSEHSREIAQRRLRIETDLRAHLDAGRMQFVFLPIFTVSDRTLVGFETLARWPDDSVDPSEFVPIAEETGLIVELGAQAIADSCRRLRAWAPALPTRSILTVKCSRRQAFHPGTADSIERALAATGVDPSALVLEIEESVLADDRADVRQALGALRTTGVRIAIDNFGAGAASLGVLRSGLIDVVKIDRSFLASETDEEESRAMLGAITTLARRLGLPAIAEGVRGEQQFPMLRSMGCEMCQGHALAPPLDAAEADALVHGPRRLAA